MKVERDFTKLIRVGERITEEKSPMPFRRTIHITYRHKNCPTNITIIQ